jgi:hypothetical protein
MAPTETIMNAMPEILDDDVEATFTYDQLSEHAKKRVRDRVRNNPNYPHDSWFECIYEDADTIAGFMGITIDRRQEKRRDGSIRDAGPDIMFSGFWSQGDGACFNGRWSAAETTYERFCQLLDHAPTDTHLHEIAFAFAKAAYDLRHFQDVVARIEQDGHYYHSGCTNIEVEFDEPDCLHGLDSDHFLRVAFDALTGRVMDGMEKHLTDLLRHFMDWIYRSLNDCHDAEMEDEAIDYHIEANMEDVLFDEDGDEI